ncbi:hypothetical protein L1887_51347 [Cichorium endivia]|nr:hypothetical protein L1887_51347 [Cichorium endivia]
MFAEAVDRVLHLPTVASRTSSSPLATAASRGSWCAIRWSARTRWRVADVAVTRTSYGFNESLTGEAVASGERTPLALISAAAAARMAVAESLTNIAAASIESLERIKLSANWMCAAGHSDEGARLYEAVQAVGLDLCPKLGLAIPVGKDSMSMKMAWQERAGRTARGHGAALVDRHGVRARGRYRVFRQLGHEAPDVEDAGVLKAFFEACYTLKQLRVQKRDEGSLVLAYHDRSDGGLLTTVLEMCFAGRCGAEIFADVLAGDKADPVAALFNEELGAVLQVRAADVKAVSAVFTAAGVASNHLHVVGRVTEAQEIKVAAGGQVLMAATRAELQKKWAETSFRMQSLRDNPQTAAEEFSLIEDESGAAALRYELTYNPRDDVLGSQVVGAEMEARPKVAILREQGVNGQIEMAWAFARAGFCAVDVHMSDLVEGRVTLDAFVGLAACGGFSFGDVLGAGSGWAKSILLNPAVRAQFERFFQQRTDTFALGVCNGCQLLSQLAAAGLIPEAEHWPLFKANVSGRFEGRLSNVEITSTGGAQSIFLRDMAGSVLPAIIAHGEGRATFRAEGDLEECRRRNQVAMQFTDQRYPVNPNGSPEGVTAVTANGGRGAGAHAASRTWRGTVEHELGARARACSWRQGMERQRSLVQDV